MNDSQLDQLLKSCGSCVTPSGFRSDVWNRIAAEPESHGWVGAWKSFVTETFLRLSQPAAAFATCATFLIAGSLLGLGTRPDAPAPELQYIRTVSPFLDHSNP